MADRSPDWKRKRSPDSAQERNQVPKRRRHSPPAATVFRQNDCDVAARSPRDDRFEAKREERQSRTHRSSSALDSAFPDRLTASLPSSRQEFDSRGLSPSGQVALRSGGKEKAADGRQSGRELVRKTSWEEAAEKAAAEKMAADKALAKLTRAAEKAAADRAAAERSEARLLRAAEKAAAEKAAAEKAEARLMRAAEKAAADKSAAEKAEAKRKKAAEKAAAEKAAAQKAEDKLRRAQKAATAHAAAEREAEEIAREKAARANAEKSAAEVAAERASRVFAKCKEAAAGKLAADEKADAAELELQQATDEARIAREKADDVADLQARLERLCSARNFDQPQTQSHTRLPGTPIKHMGSAASPSPPSPPSVSPPASGRAERSERRSEEAHTQSKAAAGRQVAVEKVDGYGYGYGHGHRDRESSPSASSASSSEVLEEPSARHLSRRHSEQSHTKSKAAGRHAAVEKGEREALPRRSEYTHSSRDSEQSYTQSKAASGKHATVEKAGGVNSQKRSDHARSSGHSEQSHTQSKLSAKKHAAEEHADGENSQRHSQHTHSSKHPQQTRTQSKTAAERHVVGEEADAESSSYYESESENLQEHSDPRRSAKHSEQSCTQSKCAAEKDAALEKADEDTSERRSEYVQSSRHSDQSHTQSHSHSHSVRSSVGGASSTTYRTNCSDSTDKSGFDKEKTTEDAAPRSGPSRAPLGGGLLKVKAPPRPVPKSGSLGGGLLKVKFPRPVVKNDASKAMASAEATAVGSSAIPRSAPVNESEGASSSQAAAPGASEPGSQTHDADDEQAEQRSESSEAAASDEDVAQTCEAEDETMPSQTHREQSDRQSASNSSSSTSGVAPAASRDASKSFLDYTSSLSPAMKKKMEGLSPALQEKMLALYLRWKNSQSLGGGGSLTMKANPKAVLKNVKSSTPVPRISTFRSRSASIKRARERVPGAKVPNNLLKARLKKSYDPESVRVESDRSDPKNESSKSAAAESDEEDVRPKQVDATRTDDKVQWGGPKRSRPAAKLTLAAGQKSIANKILLGAAAHLRAEAKAAEKKAAESRNSAKDAAEHSEKSRSQNFDDQSSKQSRSGRDSVAPPSEAASPRRSGRDSGTKPSSQAASPRSFLSSRSSKEFVEFEWVPPSSEQRQEERPGKVASFTDMLRSRQSANSRGERSRERSRSPSPSSRLGSSSKTDFAKPKSAEVVGSKSVQKTGPSQPASSTAAAAGGSKEMAAPQASAPQASCTAAVGAASKEIPAPRAREATFHTESDEHVKTQNTDSQTEAVRKDLKEKSSSTKWTCPACDEPNNGSRTNCNNCGKPRPPDVVADHEAELKKFLDQRSPLREAKSSNAACAREQARHGQEDARHDQESPWRTTVKTQQFEEQHRKRSRSRTRSTQGFSSGADFRNFPSNDAAGRSASAGNDSSKQAPPVQAASSGSPVKAPPPPPPAPPPPPPPPPPVAEKLATDKSAAEAAVAAGKAAAAKAAIEAKAAAAKAAVEQKVAAAKAAVEAKVAAAKAAAEAEKVAAAKAAVEAKAAAAKAAAEAEKVAAAKAAMEAKAAAAKAAAEAGKVAAAKAAAEARAAAAKAAAEAKAAAAKNSSPKAAAEPSARMIRAIAEKLARNAAAAEKAAAAKKSMPKAAAEHSSSSAATNFEDQSRKWAKASAPPPPPPPEPGADKFGADKNAAELAAAQKSAPKPAVEHSGKIYPPNFEDQSRKRAKIVPPPKFAADKAAAAPPPAEKAAPAVKLTPKAEAAAVKAPAEKAAPTVKLTPKAAAEHVNKSHPPHFEDQSGKRARVTSSGSQDASQPASSAGIAAGKSKEASAPPARGEGLKKQGNEHFKAGRHREARDLYVQALRTDPQNAILLSNCAAANLMLQCWDDAFHHAHKAVGIDPTNAKACERLARSLFLLDRLQPEATQFCQNYMKNLSAEQRESPEWKSFMTTAERILSHAAALQEREQSLLDRKKAELEAEAERILKSVADTQQLLNELEAKSPYAQRLRLTRLKGLLFPIPGRSNQSQETRKKWTQDALTEVDEFLKDEPKNPEAHNLRAKCLLRLGRRLGAQTELKEAMSIAGGSGGEHLPSKQLLDTLATLDAQMVTGNKEFERQDWKAALEAYDIAIKADEDRWDVEFSAQLYCKRGNVHSKMKAANSAMEDVKEALSLDPSDIKAIFLRGLVYMELDQHASALTDFEHVKEKSPGFPGLNEWLPRARLNSFRPPQKKNYYKLLGIEKEATEEEIKKAYKKSCLKWHPDKNRDNPEQAEQMFKDVKEAFECLSDPKKRQKYDNPPPERPSSWHGGGNKGGGRGGNYHNSNYHNSNRWGSGSGNRWGSGGGGHGGRDSGSYRDGGRDSAGHRDGGRDSGSYRDGGRDSGRYKDGGRDSSGYRGHSSGDYRNHPAGGQAGGQASQAQSSAGYTPPRPKFSSQATPPGSASGSASTDAATAAAQAAAAARMAAATAAHQARMAEMRFQAGQQMHGNYGKW